MMVQLVILALIATYFLPVMTDAAQITCNCRHEILMYHTTAQSVK